MLIANTTLFTPEVSLALNVLILRNDHCLPSFLEHLASASYVPSLLWILSSVHSYIWSAWREPLRISKYAQWMQSRLISSQLLLLWSYNALPWAYFELAGDIGVMIGKGKGRAIVLWTSCGFMSGNRIANPPHTTKQYNRLGRASTQLCRVESFSGHPLGHSLNPDHIWQP